MGQENKDQDYSLTSFDYVIVEKDKLIKTLKENRDKHDEIYKAACQGYWIKCKEALEEKKKEFSYVVDSVTKRFSFNCDEISAAIEGKDNFGIKNFDINFNFSSYWPLKHPTNHLDDYSRVIEMLEFSVADKVRLTAQHFSAYVRNDWDWKGEFAISNLGYVKAYTGSAIFGNIMAVSGMGVANSTSAYQFALNNGR